MPKTLDGRRLSKKEHRQWQKVRSKTGSGGKATAAVRRSRRKR